MTDLTMRILLEKISRNISFPKKLPEDFASTPIIISPGAALSYWKSSLGDHDPLLLNIVKAYVGRGQIVWDIGANVGLFTFAAAAKIGHIGRVLAVEADTWCVSLLRRSCQLKANQQLAVDVLPAAVSNSVDLVKFHIAQRGRAANHLEQSKGSTQTGGIRETQIMPSITLDWLLEHYAYPDFIKIDIEGAERLALEGGHRVLTKVRPKLLCEVSDEHKAWITNTLQEYDYLLYDAAQLDRGPQLNAQFNTLAIPIEQKSM
ncbi:MAG: FkbM family methyltransferase [Anaerolineae bacterium]|nr:FkbM family methyltransferase [Anaerolineae bacterium]